MTQGTHSETVGGLSAAAGVDLASGAADHAALMARLDGLGARLDQISAELAESRAAREQWTELFETMVPVARGVMDMTTRELSDLETDVTIDDVTRFARTTARALPQVESLVGQLGSLSELGHEVTSISGAGLARLTEILQVAEDKGYFLFAREGAAIADRVVTSFTEADLKALGDNVVTILNAVRQMTQPEVMALLNRTALTIQEVEDHPVEPPSMLALLKSMRDPQTRRGLARVLSMLHTVGEESSPTGQLRSAQAPPTVPPVPSGPGTT